VGRAVGVELFQQPCDIVERLLESDRHTLSRRGDLPLSYAKEGTVAWRVAFINRRLRLSVSHRCRSPRIDGVDIAQYNVNGSSQSSNWSISISAFCINSALPSLRMWFTTAASLRLAAIFPNSAPFWNAPQSESETLKFVWTNDSGCTTLSPSAGVVDS
jgi:hypothetical protein